eukprot:evm.model.scf_1009.4 EVM.evm.TU.scf_1009.4   scf_1009:26717-31198(-)
MQSAGACMYLLALAVVARCGGTVAIADSLGEVGDRGVWAAGQTLHVLHRHRQNEHLTGLSNDHRSLLQGKEVRTGDRDRALWDAAARGDVPALQKAIKSGGDVDTKGAAVGQEDEVGETAADKICKCVEFAGKDNLLQCPKGGCDKEATVKKIRNILKK